MPNSCPQRDRFGLIIDLCMRFIVVVACYNSLPQSCNGKFGLTLHNHAIKWFLNVRIARSAAFLRCMFGVTN